MGRYVVLDSTTGEVTQDLGENIDGAYFVALHEGESVYYGSKYKYFEFTKMNFDYVKFNYKASLKLYEVCPQILLLIPFIGFKDNVLKFANGHNATMKGLARSLGFSEDYFKGKFLKKLKDLELVKVAMIKGKRAIVVNPYVVYKGKEILIEVKELFKDTDWAILANGGSNGRQSE